MMMDEYLGEYLKMDKESLKRYLESLSYIELKELMMHLMFKLNEGSEVQNGN